MVQAGPRRHVIPPGDLESPALQCVVPGRRVGGTAAVGEGTSPGLGEGEVRWSCCWGGGGPLPPGVEEPRGWRRFACVVPHCTVRAVLHCTVCGAPLCYMARSALHYAVLSTAPFVSCRAAPRALCPTALHRASVHCAACVAPHCAAPRTTLCVPRCSAPCCALHCSACAFPHCTPWAVLHCTATCCSTRHRDVLPTACTCAHRAVVCSALHSHSARAYEPKTASLPTVTGRATTVRRRGGGVNCVCCALLQYVCCAALHCACCPRQHFVRRAARAAARGVVLL